MNDFTVGVYWKDRAATLGEFARDTRDFLFLLQDSHPVFELLESTGDSPGSDVSLELDLSNLDDLICLHAWNKDLAYEHENPDGSPCWNSTGPHGFDMRFNTGASPSFGGVRVGMHAGDAGPHSSNTVTIHFPGPDHPGFAHRAFHDYAFIKRLFEQTIRFWKPEHGLVSSHPFHQAVEPQGLPGVGWLTYLRDERAMTLRHDAELNELMIERVDVGGVLIALGTDIISPDNPRQVEQARRLRNKLAGARLIEI